MTRRMNSRPQLWLLEDRLTPTSGLLDPTFGPGGRVQTPFPIPSDDVASAVKIDAQGRLVVAATSAGSMMVLRYNSDGSLDNSFGMSGTSLIDNGTFNDTTAGLALDSQGHIVVLGSTLGKFYIARLTEAGQLDSSFGINGQTTIDFGQSAQTPKAVTVDSLDRIVVAGFARASNSNTSMALARLTISGGLDLSFHGIGEQLITIGTAKHNEAHGVTVDSQGRVVLAGFTDVGGIGQFAFVRLTGAGELDLSFNATGMQSVDFGNGATFANALVVDSMDRVVAAGVSGGNFAIVRLTNTGAPDGSFDGDGKKTISFGDASGANGIAIDTAGRIVAGGFATDASSSQYFAAIRLLANGSLDSGFNGGGISFAFSSGPGTQSGAASGVTVDASDRVVLAGNANLVSKRLDVALARVTTTGALDVTFDSDGRQTMGRNAGSDAAATAVAIDHLGRIVVVGSGTSPTGGGDAAVARYLADGSLDTSFGIGGTVMVNFLGLTDTAQSVAIDSLNRIIIAGYTEAFLSGSVARLTATGALDTSFDADGRKFINAGDRSFLQSVVVDSSDRIVLGGQVINGLTSGMLAARLTSVGDLDSSFGSGGTTTVFDQGGADLYANAVALDSTGRVILAGGSQNSLGANFVATWLSGAGVLVKSVELPFFDGVQQIKTAIAYGLAVDQADNVVVTGLGSHPFPMSGRFFLAARLTKIGTLDSSFNGTGQWLLNEGNSSLSGGEIALDSIGRIVISGSRDNQFVAIQLTIAGTLDSSFDGDGIRTIDFPPFIVDHIGDTIGAAIDASNRIVLAGGLVTYDYSEFGVARLTTDLSVTIDASGNLVIADDGGSGFSNSVTIFADTINNRYEIDCDSVVSTSIAGATGNGTSIVTIPFSAVTGGQIQVNTADGFDTVTFDWSKGNFPKDIVADLGSGLGGELILRGPGFTSASETFTNGTDGKLALDPVGPDPAHNLTFTHVDFADFSGAVVSEWTFQVPATGTLLDDDGTSGNGVCELFSSTNLFPTTLFSNPGNSLSLTSSGNSPSLTIGPSTDLDCALTIGSVAKPFSSITITGGMTLTSNHNLTITSNGVINFSTNAADIAATGSGAISIATSLNILLASGSSIKTATGSLTLNANQQAKPSSGSFSGINITSAVISSSGGSVTLLGRGGNTSSACHGIIMNGGSITGGGPGTTLTITGTGGSSPTNGAACGINIIDAFIDGKISTAGGDAVVTGIAGGTTATLNNVGIALAGSISTSGAGQLTVNGTGGPNGSTTTTTNNHGVFFTAPTSNISAGGTLAITGAEGGGVCLGIFVADGTISGAPISLTTDLFGISPSATISAGASSLTFRERTNGRNIFVGGSGSGLALSDTALDLCTAGTLIIGDASAGNLTVSASVTRPTTTNMQLVSGANIITNPGSITTAGGTLLFSPGSSGNIQPTRNGVDVNASNTTFALGSNLGLVINGTTVDTQYRQLNVAGGVNLTGANLSLSGSYTPVLGDKFTIVANDDMEPIVGNFAGRPEGSVVAFNGVQMTITYVGGTGNDVVLAFLPPHVVSVQVNDGSAQRSRVTSLLVTFDSPVTLPANKADAFQLRRQSDSALVGLTANQSGNAVTLTFNSGTSVDFGSLADGLYTLKVVAAKVNSGNFDGNNDGTTGDDYQLIGDPATNKLFRLFGDADGNATVNSDDFAAFRSFFGVTGPAFDFDGNGVVNSDDFAEFRKRFGITLMP